MTYLRKSKFLGAVASYEIDSTSWRKQRPHEFRSLVMPLPVNDGAKVTPKHRQQPIDLRVLRKLPLHRHQRAPGTLALPSLRMSPNTGA